MLSNVGTHRVRQPPFGTHLRGGGSLGALADILAILDRWDAWKVIKAGPKRIDALERRVASLEQAAAAGPTDERCRFCKTGELMLTDVSPDPMFGEMGVEKHTLVCQNPDCGRTDVRQIDTHMGR